MLLKHWLESYLPYTCGEVSFVMNTLSPTCIVPDLSKVIVRLTGMSPLNTVSIAAVEQ